MTFVGLALTGCEPMEEIHNEIDAELDNQLAVADADYVLTEDDYEDLGQSFPNFSSVADARTLIPSLLSDLYPTYGAGSIINVEFDLYDPIRVEDYTVTDEDYNNFGLSNNYFTSASIVGDFLEGKFDTAEEGSYVEVTYDVVATDIEYELTDDDFALIGEQLGDVYPDPASSAAQFENFDRRETRDAYWSDDMIYEAVEIVLLDQLNGVAGQTYKVSYPIYTGSSGEESVTVVFDGNSYSEFMTTPPGEDYEVSETDIDLIVTGLSDDSEFDDAVSNLDRFGNFNRQLGSDSYWSDSMLAEAFTIALNANFPDAEDGKVYIVQYSFFDGSGGTGSLAVVKNGDVYEIATTVSTISETTVFAYTNGYWNQPLSLEGVDYTEMGQSFPNFSDNEEALYKIGIFLGLEFPYAEAGDMMAVEYNFYGGSDVGTYKRYANFVFEDRQWNAVPSVISNSLQFGYEDGMWVPDNTINRILSGDDYSIIAGELSSNADLSTQISSMERYSNFDRRPGASAYWSDANILLAMQTLLEEIAPNAEEGQKYVLTFDIYNGSNTTESLSLIKENGEWVVNN
jgi:hypothetical protein